MAKDTSNPKWPAAAFMLGEFKLSGTNGLQKAPEEGAALVRKAAEAGEPVAQEGYSTCLQFGLGVKKDETEAIAWRRKFVESGNPYVQCDFGMRLVGLSMFPYSRSDVTEGMKWLLASADQDFPLAENVIGQLYEQGLGVAKDPMLAYAWYYLAKSHDRSHASVFADVERLEKALTSEQLKKGQELAREILAKRPAKKR